VQKLIVSTIALSFISISPLFAQYSGGDGSEADPWQIACPNDLLYLADHNEDYGSHFILTVDINLAGYTFTTAVIAPQGGVEFTGTFDGNDFVIRNLIIDTNGAGNDHLGLFGSLEGSSAEVRNLGLENASIKGGNGSNFLGGLCGWSSEASITNCYATGAVIGGDNSWDLGGLVGYNEMGLIRFCYTMGAVTGGIGAAGLGGLAGFNCDGIISNCYATGAVTGNDDCWNLGGLVGFNEGEISNCHCEGSVSGMAYIGGVVGSHEIGNLSGCSFKGTVTATGSYCGGIAGINWSRAKISHCSSSGIVSGPAQTGGLTGGNCSGLISDGVVECCYSISSVEGNWLVGGLVGLNKAIVSDCYATGCVSGDDTIGGLVGENGTSNLGYGRVLRSYSTGVVFGTTNVGGLIGLNDFGSVSNSFWDVGTSGQNDSDGGEGKSTAEMKKKNTFTGWDFVETWGIEDNQTYPFLRLTYPVGDIDLDGDVDFIDFAYFAKHWLEE
jgi:hypothetical protein